ncbi:MAG: GNVR domain-containing protein [Steroidobacteraceae bacterium]|jgi:uncharacterized protein involved in exopolysaccharide biosynthesis
MTEIPSKAKPPLGASGEEGSDSAEYSVRFDPILIAAASWRLILCCVALAAAISVAIAWNSVPVFRAEVTLTPAKKDDTKQLTNLSGSIGSLASLAGVNLASNDTETDRAIAILKSREFTDAFIRDNDLAAALCVDCKAWWRLGGAGQPTARHAYDVFDKTVRSIQQDKKIGTATLAIEWRDPQLAAQWANELVARLNRHEQQQAIDEAERNIGFLNQQLAKTDVAEMRQLIYRLIESKTSDIMLAAGRPEYAFAIIDPAVVPERKIRPRRMMMVLTGLVLGLMVGVGAALVRARYKGLWSGR